MMGRRAGECGRRRVLIRRSVWAVGVVVRDELLHDLLEVARSGDQEVVGAFAAHACLIQRSARVARAVPPVADRDRGADDGDVRRRRERDRRRG